MKESLGVKDGQLVFTKQVRHLTKGHIVRNRLQFGNCLIDVLLSNQTQNMVIDGKPANLIRLS